MGNTTRGNRTTATHGTARTTRTGDHMGKIASTTTAPATTTPTARMTDDTMNAILAGVLREAFGRENIPAVEASGGGRVRITVELDTVSGAIIGSASFTPAALYDANGVMIADARATGKGDALGRLGAFFGGLGYRLFAGKADKNDRAAVKVARENVREGLAARRAGASIVRAVATLDKARARAGKATDRVTTLEDKASDVDGALDAARDAGAVRLTRATLPLAVTALVPDVTPGAVAHAAD